MDDVQIWISRIRPARRPGSSGARMATRARSSISRSARSPTTARRDAMTAGLRLAGIRTRGGRMVRIEAILLARENENRWRARICRRKSCKSATACDLAIRPGAPRVFSLFLTPTLSKGTAITLCCHSTSPEPRLRRRSFEWAIRRLETSRSRREGGAATSPRNRTPQTTRRMFVGRQQQALLHCIKETGDGARPITFGPTMTINTLSTITCPSCAHRATEMMPTDAVQSSYQCKGCGTVLRPKAGHDCVFCSYGDIPCPPIQAERAASAKAGSCCGGCGG